MTSRTAYAGTAATNDVLTAANINNLPGGWIGYVQATASQSSITSLVDITGLSQAVTVNTSRRIKITLYVPRWSSTNGGDVVELSIQEGATVLETFRQADTTISISDGGGGPVWVGTPSSGSHTYKGTVSRSNGSGSITLVGGATEPMWLLVEDIGPA